MATPPVSDSHGAVLVYHIPRTARNKFKAFCSIHNIHMNEAIVHLVELVASGRRLLPDNEIKAIHRKRKAAVR